jgi:chromosome segregation ATPase
MRTIVIPNPLLLSLLLLLWGSAALAGIDRNLQQVYITRYLDKAYYLKMPIPGRDLTLAVRSGGEYLPDFDSTSFRPLFTLGEKVRITDIDFGGRDITFEVASFDASKKAKIRFEFSAELDGPFSASDDFNAVLAKIFTMGLTPADLDQAPQEYITDRYRQFIRDEARLSDLSEAEIHRFILAENSAARALQQDVNNLQARIREQDAALAAVRRDLEQARNELRELQQNKAILQSAARDYQERIQNLDTRVNRLEARNRSLESEKEALIRAIRSAMAEAGLGDAATGSPDRLIDSLSREFRQAKVANRTYEGRVAALESSLADAQRVQAEQATRIESLTAEIATARRTISDLNNQLTLLTTQDKNKAAQLMELQRQKNVIESKLLSQSLVDIRTERRTTPERQEITVQLDFKEQSLGTITITAPRELSTSEPNRVTLRNGCRTAEDLRRGATADLRLMLEHLERFPDFQVVMEARGEGFQVKTVQSPQRDNTDLWVWEIIPESKSAADLVVRFQSKVEGEAMPVFDVPVSVPYPTIEKKLAEFFEPLPTAIGILIGLLLALPFFLILRRRRGRTGAPPPETPRSGGMHFDNKEL